jgi:large subunit ribosomal protein L23
MILMQPIITEKSMRHAGDGKYTFLVVKTATKTEVKKAVEKAFNVHVTKVSSVTTKGRTKRVGAKREEVMLPAFKKAIVVVKKGEKIALFEESK